MAAAKTGRALRGSAATTRLRLVECQECGYKGRVARVWLVRCAELGRRPTCMVCGSEASCPDMLDAALYDDLAMQAVRDTAWECAHTPVIRDGQVRDLRFFPRSENAKKRVPRHRCDDPHCSHWATKGKRYCKSHADQEMPF